MNCKCISNLHAKRVPEHFLIASRNSFTMQIEDDLDVDTRAAELVRSSTVITVALAQSRASSLSVSATVAMARAEFSVLIALTARTHG